MGLQRILKLNQADPRVMAIQKKLVKYVDQAEKLQQKLDEGRKPQAAAGINSIAMHRK